MNNTPTPGSLNDFLDANMREQGWGFVWEAMLAHYWEHSLPMWRAFKSRRRPHISGLSLLLVLSFALRGFSPGAQVFPSPRNQFFVCCWFAPFSERFFSGCSGFPLSSKLILSKSNLICSAPSRLN